MRGSELDSKHVKNKTSENLKHYQKTKESVVIYIKRIKKLLGKDKLK